MAMRTSGCSVLFYVLPNEIAPYIDAQMAN